MPRKSPQPEKIELWRRRIAAWRESGQSVMAYCRRERLSAPSLYAWRRRLAGTVTAAATSSFVPVTVVRTTAVSAEVELKSGLVLRLHDVALDQLGVLVRALESAC
jgi:hypothetical protein